MHSFLLCRTVFLFATFTIIVMAVGIINGMPMISYFKGCDPVKSGEIDFADQLIPLMAVQLFRSRPGLAGLFVSSAYSGMLRFKLVSMLTFNFRKDVLAV